MLKPFFYRPSLEKIIFFIFFEREDVRGAAEPQAPRIADNLSFGDIIAVCIDEGSSTK